MNGTALKKTWRGMAAELAAMAGLALVFAMLAPFGMSAIPLGRRIALWLAFVIGGYLCFRPVIAGGRALSVQTRLPSWLTIALACAIAAMPTTMLVAWTLAGHHLTGAPIAALGALYPQVVLIGGIVTVARLLSRRRDAAPTPAAGPVERTPAPAPPIEPTTTRNALFDQLPPAIGCDLLYIGNEDHYVRVHTREGDALLLMRMRDAVEALAEVDGARVHRGWWVARQAVRGVVRHGRALRLSLVDGHEIPVARPMVAKLRAKGWF